MVQSVAIEFLSLFPGAQGAVGRGGDGVARMTIGWPPTEREGRWIMVTVGSLATRTAKPGKESELAEFLTSALPLAEGEPETTAWFAIKIDDRTFGIFDVFPTADGRRAHLAGPIASALMAKAGGLLDGAPDIKPVDVLAVK